MAIRLFTGTTCGGGSVITFITDDTLILANPINRVYQFDDGTCFTLTQSGSTTTSSPTKFIAYGPYTTCALCLAPTNSAGITSIICASCDSVNSVTATTAPHAIYTNGQGKSIIQNNTITVGGFNGLNN
ncbi:MAG: hypothetical protein EBS55_11005 [Flavobacteriaceae bacterium]|nr:hypothetical protein [Flavobacteriaceae bacterium]